ncbi:MAG: capsule assembly Wzi family protein [Candidatus Eisenbacteria bacterium]
MRAALATLLILLAVSLVHASLCSSSTISNVPSDTRMHGYFEELARRGLLRGVFFSERPYSREDICRAVASLEEAVKSGRVELSPYEAWLLARLTGELGPDAPARSGSLESKPSGGAWRPEDPGYSPRASRVECGAEFQVSGVSADTELTRTVEIDGETSEDTESRSDERTRAFGTGWCEVTMPYGMSLSHRFRIDIDIEEDPGFIGRPWRGDIGGYVMNGYGKFRLGPLEALLGRDKHYWGPGRSGSLILSDVAPPFDMVSYKFNLGRVKLSGFFTSLDDLRLKKSVPFASDSLYPGDETSRHLSGHRIDIRVTPNLEVGFSETVVYGGPDRELEPGYINPLNFFYSHQWNLVKNDNPLWGFDACWWPARRVQVYGQLVVDDFQFENKKATDEEPGEVGFLLGLHAGDPFDFANTSLALEYVRINPWTYNQPFPWNRYTYGGVLLGHPLGPDADGLYSSLVHWFNDRLTVGLDYSFVRRGETSVESDWPVPIGIPWGEASFPEGFPLGTVEKSHRVGLQATFHPSPYFDLDGFAAIERATGAGNERDAKSLQYEVGLRASFRPAWVFGLAQGR